MAGRNLDSLVSMLSTNGKQSLLHIHINSIRMVFTPPMMSCISLKLYKHDMTMQYSTCTKHALQADHLHSQLCTSVLCEGVVVVEGEADDVQEYTSRIRSLSWQAMQVRVSTEIIQKKVSVLYMRLAAWYRFLSCMAHVRCTCWGSDGRELAVLYIIWHVSNPKSHESFCKCRLE